MVRLTSNCGTQLTVSAAAPSGVLREKPTGTCPVPHILGKVENLPAVEQPGLHDRGSRSNLPLEIGKRGVQASAWGRRTSDAIGVSVESQTRQTTSPLLPLKHRLPIGLTTTPTPRSHPMGNTVSMASQPLERRSKRFGCVWLSLIAIPFNATASDCAARELFTSRVSSQPLVQPAPQHNPPCNRAAPHVSTFGTCPTGPPTQPSL
jgi:hypothetical protein